jgi:cysteine desulfurase
MRAGTENLYGIVGFAKALQMATENHEQDSSYIKGLKVYMMERLKKTSKVFHLTAILWEEVYMPY